MALALAIPGRQFVLNTVASLGFDFDINTLFRPCNFIGSHKRMSDTVDFAGRHGDNSCLVMVIISSKRIEAIINTNKNNP